MKKLIYLSLLIITFSCKKESKTITYSGYIYSKLDSTPLRNTAVDIYKITTPLGSSRRIDQIKTFSTDSFGYFTVDFYTYASGSVCLKWPYHSSYNDYFYYWKQYGDSTNTNPNAGIIYATP